MTRGGFCEGKKCHLFLPVQLRTGAPRGRRAEGGQPPPPRSLRARQPFPAPPGPSRRGSASPRWNAPGGEWNDAGAAGHVARMECQQCSECPDCAPHSAPGTAKGEDGERPAPPRPPPPLSRAVPTPQGERRRRAPREGERSGCGGRGLPLSPGWERPPSPKTALRGRESPVEKRGVRVSGGGSVLEAGASVPCVSPLAGAAWAPCPHPPTFSGHSCDSAAQPRRSGVGVRLSEASAPAGRSC